MRQIKTLLFVTSVALTLLAGCASQPPVLSDEARRVVMQADIGTTSGRAARIASEQVGIRYKYGGATPNTGFDCSGLVQFAYQQAGQSVPRTSAAQYSASTRISLDEARPGDLLFFARWRKVNHVGIYIGDGMFVHAPSGGKHVTVGKMSNPYYQKHFVSAGRMNQD